MNTIFTTILATTATWNTLEIAKLLVSALVPIIILYVGYIISQRLKKIESIQASNMVLLKWKMRIYEQMAPLLNDIRCYLVYEGDWKTMTPEQILSSKRSLDKEFYMIQPLFSPEFSNAYNQFMELCFQMRTGKGEDAKIRSGYDERKKRMGDSWETRYDSMFFEPAPGEKTREERTKKREEQRSSICKSYVTLMRSLTCELGFFLKPDGNDI